MSLDYKIDEGGWNARGLYCPVCKIKGGLVHFGTPLYCPYCGSKEVFVTSDVFSVRVEEDIVVETAELEDLNPAELVKRIKDEYHGDRDTEKMTSWLERLQELAEKEEE